MSKHDNIQARGAPSWARRIALFTSGSALVAIAILITSEVIFRYFFRSPHVWAAEATGALMAVVFFGGLPLAWERRAHVRVGFVQMALGYQMRRLIQLFALLCISVFWAAYAFSLYELALEMHQYDTRPMFIDLPYWPLASVMTVFAVICLVQAIVSAVALLRGKLTWTQ